MSAILRLAVQSKGRLAQDSLALLQQCGLQVLRTPGALTARARGLPVDLLFVRDDDIAGLVSAGVCDLGIAGENVVREVALEDPKADNLQTIRRLGFSRCALKLAAPKAGDIKTPADLEGKTIATSYPAQLRAWLNAQGLGANIVVLKGAVEIAPALDLADAICDLVSSGATLIANGLSDFATVLQSEALLIGNDTALEPQKADLLARLLRRMDGVIASRATKYIMLNAPRAALDEITALLPGADAPTIMDLAGDKTHVAVHAVCRETIFWDTLEALEARGAKAILVLPIEKMMG